MAVVLTSIWITLFDLPGQKSRGREAMCAVVWKRLADDITGQKEATATGFHRSRVEERCRQMKTAVS